MGKRKIVEYKRERFIHGMSSNGNSFTRDIFNNEQSSILLGDSIATHSFTSLRMLADRDVQGLRLKASFFLVR
jgi:hypothetical protein